MPGSFADVISCQKSVYKRLSFADYCPANQPVLGAVRSVGGHYPIDRLSYVMLKDGHESLLAKRADIEVVHNTLFGDCPTFIRDFPTVTRRDWRYIGELVSTYNRLCPQL